MRVALVGTFPLHPVSFKGGVETSTWNLIEGLLSFEDMEIHVVTSNNSLRKYIRVVSNSVRYHYLPSPKHWQTLSLYMLDRFRINRKLHEINPDIVHAQNSQNYGYICLKTRFPIVLSVHGIVKEEANYISGLKNRLRAIIRGQMIQKYCVQNSPHIIQPTRYPEQYFGYLETGKWHDTGNAIASQFFDVKGETEKCRVFYSGAVIPRKRLHDLIIALGKVKKRFSNVTLRIAGGTPDKEYLKKIKGLISTYNLDANVVFLGLLSQPELVEEYRKCALLVLPSGQETSPMVIAEIMAVGKPVVATRVGGVPYLIDDKQTGIIVDVGDINGLANGIDIILSDDELQVRMGNLAKEKANNRFRCRIVAEKVLQVYHEAIDSYKENWRNVSLVEASADS